VKDRKKQHKPTTTMRKASSESRTYGKNVWRKRRKMRIKKKTGMGSRNISAQNLLRITPSLCNLPCGKAYKHQPTMKDQHNRNPPIKNQLIPPKNWNLQVQ
jgi:hypothetical protein